MIQVGFSNAKYIFIGSLIISSLGIFNKPSFSQVCCSAPDEATIEPFLQDFQNDENFASIARPTVPLLARNNTFSAGNADNGGYPASKHGDLPPEMKSETTVVFVRSAN